eukprot:3827023-Pyramimonas_sp.AAC.1
MCLLLFADDRLGLEYEVAGPLRKGLPLDPSHSSLTSKAPAGNILTTCPLGALKGYDYPVLVTVSD